MAENTVKNNYKRTGIINKNTQDVLNSAEGIMYGIGKTSSTAYMKANDAKDNKLSSNAVKAVERNGLYQASTINSNMYTKYSKFGYNDPYNRMPNTKEVLFFTKPNLHIMDGSTDNLQDEISNNEFFINLKNYYPEVIDSLQLSHKSGSIFLLHNRVKDTLDLPDLNSVDIDIATNMHGNNYEYRGSSEASDDGYTFSLEFEDTRHLDVYMLFKAYDEYERLKRLGRVTPEQTYIENKILHDQIAIYKFTLLDDMMTIAHYAKLWGCYPTSVPRSVFGNGDFGSAGLSLSVQWKCAFIEDMNPLILYEFNNWMSKSIKGLDYSTPTKEIIPTYNSKSGRINRTWATGAVVQMEKPTTESTTMVPRLRWIKSAS